MTEFSDCIAYIDAFKVEVFARLKFILDTIADLEFKLEEEL